MRNKRAQKRRRLPPRETAPLSLEPGQRKSLAFHAALSQNQLTHAGGVSLTAGSLHDLTDDSASSLNLTGANLVGNVGHCCQCFLDGCGERAVVGDHGEAACLNDFGGGAFTSEDELEHLAGDLVVDLAFGDERFEGDHGCRLHTEGGELNFSLLCAAGDFAHPPLAGCCCGCACGDGLFDDVECASVDYVAELFVGVAPFALEAAAAFCRGFGQFGAQALNPLAVGDDRYVLNRFKSI